MIDSVLKGTGNSRFLKSAVPAGTSWADALAMLQAGTFPIDFNGINAEGFQQVGTPLNKANLLKDATAAQIGLPPSTTPDGMFQALGNTGELHVWRKTVVSSSEQPAGYTLGDVIENSEIWVENSNETVFHYATSISVSDIGLVSLVDEKTANIGHANSGQNITEFDVFKGKFVYISGGDNNKRQFIFYIPSNATFYRNGTYGTNKIYADKEQRVNAHGIIPPGTTTTYPVSTNPKAYQEGDDAKAATYVLGDVAQQFLGANSAVGSGVQMGTYYSSSVSVADDGTVSLVGEQESVWTLNSSGSAASNIQATLRGKYFRCVGYSGVKAPSGIFYMPNDAVVAYDNTGAISGSETRFCYYADRVARVTGQAAIPAGTTIEYLGKLGDKARVQVVSYVGTGTYGESNPCSLTFDFVPKMVIISTNANMTFAFFNTGILSKNFANKTVFSVLSASITNRSYVSAKKDGKTISWYSTSTPDSHFNVSGAKYIAIAIG